MRSNPRHHIDRRGRALGHLQALTTGIAVAGVAGIAGFGALAAATWSGSPAAPSGADDVSNGSSLITPRATAAPRTVPATPPTGTTPRVQRANGSAHASTGGSH